MTSPGAENKREIKLVIEMFDEKNVKSMVTPLASH